MTETMKYDFVIDNFFSNVKSNVRQHWWRGVVVITTAQLHSTKPELRLCADSNLVCGMSEIHNGEDL